MTGGRRQSHVAGVNTTGEGAALRYVAYCSCGWFTAPLLTAMQANSAARDHDGRGRA